MAKSRTSGQGRPKGALNKATADIKAIAAEHGPAIITKLAELAGIIPGNPAELQTVQVQAMRELLDRGYGRPVQSHDLTYHVDPMRMSDEELNMLAAAGLAAVADAGEDDDPSLVH
jgi:hypothetical protein